MVTTRRRVLLTALPAASLAFAGGHPKPPLKVGIMDVILGYASDPEAFAAAERIGFDGVQVSLGKPVGADRLLMSEPDLQTRILRSSAQHRVVITSTYLEILHRDCLQSNAIAQNWVRQAIHITKALKSKMVELAFFFRCELKGSKDQEALVRILRELAPEAHDSDVTLGIENTLSAEDNAHLLDQIGSPAVKIWYDIGNSTNMGHFDVPRELRFLGKDRICQIHIKDKVYLGEGAVDVKGCLQAIFDIGYSGFCVLENAVPTGDRVADAAKNLNLLRQIESQVRS